MAGGRALAEHLLDLGHRRIAIAAGTAGLTTVADRLAGLSSALKQRGLSLDTLPVVHCDFTRDGGRVATEKILRDHPETTAIIALNDAMAMAPGLNLSAFPRIVVTARVSKSGDAKAQPGDLQGASKPVANDAKGVVVEINEVVP